MNTHFNVSDQELAAANGGIAHVSPEVLKALKSAGETILKGIQYAAKNIPPSAPYFLD